MTDVTGTPVETAALSTAELQGQLEDFLELTRQDKALNEFLASRVIPAAQRGAALHKALEYANERHHEYATLEHLLLGLPGVWSLLPLLALWVWGATLVRPDANRSGA